LEIASAASLADDQFAEEIEGEDPFSEGCRIKVEQAPGGGYARIPSWEWKTLHEEGGDQDLSQGGEFPREGEGREKHESKDRSEITSLRGEAAYRLRTSTATAKVPGSRREGKLRREPTSSNSPASG